MEVMKIKIIGIYIGLMTIAAAASGQQGELVSVNEETQQAYYTTNNEYTVEDDGSYTGKIVAYYENGQVEETGTMLENTKEGNWYRYDQAGNKLAIAQYRKGQKHGTWKVWSSDGVLRVVMEYDMGKRVGTWKFYDEEGEIIEEKVFE